MAKSKLDSLYPERELKFGELTVLVKAAPGLYAADLVEAFDLAVATITSDDKRWSRLLSEVWPSIEKIIAKCVTFVDEPDIRLQDLPIGPLGEIVQAVRELTIDSAGDSGNPMALPQAVAKIYGMIWAESTKVQDSSETTSQTSA